MHKETTYKLTESQKTYRPIILCTFLLIAALILDYTNITWFANKYIRLGWYLATYIIIGYSVIKETINGFVHKEFFTEFSLMTIATIGAIVIGEYPEAVAVMLFYSVGELLQDSAVNKTKRNIKALLDIRPTTASVFRNGKFENVPPEIVSIGEIIQIKAGEKVPLDGIMLSAESSFNTSALTGESKPKTIRQSEEVLAGMLNLTNVIEIKVEKKFADSSLAKILELVQNATSKKAKTELLIRKFAKIYTPLVFGLAFLIATVPFLFVENYIFSHWFYKALVFLVISCPCALVISIPLGYFAGIGCASKNGILFKGANYLDLITKVNTIIMDKTGTLTKGVFKVQQISPVNHTPEEFITIVAALEQYSNHPIAKAIKEHTPNNNCIVTNVEEISGYGLKGIVNEETVLAGNTKLMEKYNISYNTAINSIVETIIVVAINNVYAGYIIIADELKEDAPYAISQMYAQGINNTIILSGDKNSITQKVGKELNVTSAHGDLLPQNKLEYIETIKQNTSNVIAFAGDGINDTPALALSDVGIAMGGMGSDSSIEIADVIIQTDQPSKIPVAIKIAKSTKQIVIQNIVLAISIKFIILLLGVLGIATMWEAVFADVGVSLLTVVNSVRILRKKFV